MWRRSILIILWTLGIIWSWSNLIILWTLGIIWSWSNLIILSTLGIIRSIILSTLGIIRSCVRLKSAFFILTILMAGTILKFIFGGNVLIIGYHNHVNTARKMTPQNYFLSQGDDLEFLVNTTECKILDLDPWHASIIEHIVKLDLADVCDKQIPHWTHVIGSTVVMNKTAIQESGHPLHNLVCCYKTIHRVEQSEDKYDGKADALVSYSTNCTPMEEVTTPSFDYIYVTCGVAYSQDELLPVRALYKNFHIIALPSATRVHNKINRWNQIEKDEVAERKSSFKSQVTSESQKIQMPTARSVSRPPNVVVIGMDSTSRLNFRRAMFKTKQVLDDIRAHEMLGYTKVGDNTYANTIPFLTGYDEYEMKDVCQYNETKYDDCPFIWKNYSDAFYLTAEIEDSPRLASFNLGKTGFVRQPTDFYSRPIMLAAHQAVPLYPVSLDCVGYKTVDQFLLEYMRDLLRMTTAENVPLFLMSWLTQLGHGQMNSIQTGDKYYATFLRSLVDEGLLNNSILFFMSDHGYRFGKIRNTLSGWYEDKLPNMWIRLPPSIIQKYPEWEQALRHNERQLSSTYDLYHTFVNILQTFSHMPEIEDARKRNGETLPRKFGQSFFKPFSENRTCASIGIPDSYCPCQYPVKVGIDSPIVKRAAGAAIIKINQLIPIQCVQFSLSRIRGAARLSSGSTTPSETTSLYIIDFETRPGDFSFEATVQHSIENSFVVSGSIQRVSKINTDVNCVQDSKLKLYCYCKSILKAEKDN